MLLLATLAGGLAIACDRDASTRVLEPKLRAELSLPQGIRVRPGVESRYDGFVRAVPGFGGVALNRANDVATVFFADARSNNAVAGRAQAASLVTAMFQDMLRKVPSRFKGHVPAIEFQSVNYDFGQLEAWRNLVDNNSSDLSMWTIDVAQNRIIIGVLAASTADRIRGLLAQNGVPADAYSVSVIPRVILTSTLTDHYDTPFGGVRITNATTGEGCSLGFNAYSSAFQWTYFTASHCTATFAAYDGSSFSQPSSGNGAFSHELQDVTGIQGNGSNGCTSGHWCRYSDAAVIAYNGGQQWKFSYLARTSSGTTLAGYEPIFGEHDDPVAGEEISREGATTGYGRGSITSPSANVTEVVNGKVVDIYGAAFVHTDSAAEADAGDSGGPVFLDYASPPFDPPYGMAAIAGIEFAKDSAGTGFYYSPLSSIYLDFGNDWTVFGLTSHITGPSLITSPGTYQWSANASGGGSSFTYQWDESDDGGSTWRTLSTSSIYTRTVLSIGPGLYFPFKLRVTVTTNTNPPANFATSDPFDVLMRG